MKCHGPRHGIGHCVPAVLCLCFRGSQAHRLGCSVPVSYWISRQLSVLFLSRADFRLLDPLVCAPRRWCPCRPPVSPREGFHALPPLSSSRLLIQVPTKAQFSPTPCGSSWSLLPAGCVGSGPHPLFLVLWLAFSPYDSFFISVCLNDFLQFHELLYQSPNILTSVVFAALC